MQHFYPVIYDEIIVGTLLILGLLIGTATFLENL